MEIANNSAFSEPLLSPINIAYLQRNGAKLIHQE